MTVRENVGPALTSKQIEEGRSLLKAGASLRDLAKRFNCSAPTVRKYCGPAVVELRGRKKALSKLRWADE